MSTTWESDEAVFHLFRSSSGQPADTITWMASAILTGYLGIPNTVRAFSSPSPLPKKWCQRSPSVLLAASRLASLRGGTGVAMYGSQPTTTVQIKPATYNLRTLEPAQPTTSKTRAP